MRFLPILLLIVGCGFDGSNVLNLAEDGGLPDAVQAIDAQAIDGMTPPRVDGFGSEPDFWRVPDSQSTRGFLSTDAESSFSGERWFTKDMNFDGTVDLVQTMDPASKKVWSDNGQPHWKVFLGTDNGFSESAVEWRVPNTALLDGFFAPAMVAGTIGAPGTESWDVEDLNGDGCIDFVRLLDPLTGSVWSDMAGDLYWEVYLCSTNGFTDSPIEWRVVDPIFTTLESDRLQLMSCWKLLDLTSNGRPDLIHTCGNGELAPWDSVTNPHWRVYENTSGGFSETPNIWGVPRNESSLGFFRTDSVRDGRFWRVLDLNSDGVLELIQSTPYKTEIAPIVFSDSGFPGWKVFASMASGFAIDGRWSVPVTEHVGGFFSPDEEVTNTNGIHWYWATIDINGDNLLDLVHTADTSESTIRPNSWSTASASFWKVYLGEGESFAMTPLEWFLPATNELGGFYSTQDEGWKLLDLNNDGQVALVQTMNPMTGEVWLDNLGSPYWKVFHRR